MAANKVTAVRLGLGEQPTVRDYQAAQLRWRLFLWLVRASGGIRPRSFAGLPATFSTLAPPLGTVYGLPQQGNRCFFEDERARLLYHGGLDWLRRKGLGFNNLEDFPPLRSQAPPAAQAFDQALGPDVQIRYSRGEALGPVGPVSTACSQDGHVALEILHDGKTVRIAHQDLEDRDLEVHARPRDQRHIVGARKSALRPISLRPSGDTSPLVAASKIFDATCVRAPISLRETLWHTSSKTARKTAVVVVSNMRCPNKERPILAMFFRRGDSRMLIGECGSEAATVLNAPSTRQSPSA